MLKNRTYWLKAAPVLILGIFLMYFYSGLQNDHLQVLYLYFEKLGWSARNTTNPVTWSSFAGVLMYFLIGTLLLKFGVVRIMVPSIVILGLSCIALALSGTSLLGYSIFLFLIRLFVVPLQMGAYMLCTNWFVNLRGRALGFITLGCPLFTATGVAGLTFSIDAHGLLATYVGMGVIVLILAVLVAVFVKSTPEECGLYPDGAECEIESSSGEIQSIPFKELSANSGFWLLIISFGILQFCIVGAMFSYLPRLEAVGTQQSIYLFWLSVAAIMGLPISMILGVIDDKFGTVIASIALCGTYLLGLISLLVMTANNIPLIILAALGLAGMMGGTANLHPSITTYVFGRDRYQAANRWIMAIQGILMAFALYFMSYILDTTGSFDLAYKIMLWLVGIAIICLIIIGRKPDYDRSRNTESCEQNSAFSN